MPETLDRQLEVAVPYAAALFELARDNRRTETCRAELEELARLHASDPDFAALLASPAIDADRRAASLERIFRGRISDEVLNTLLVMNRHGRAHLLPALARAFVIQDEQARNQVETCVISAVELDDEQRRSVQYTAQTISGKMPVVEYRVDPDLIGGLVMQVGDMRYDNSLRRQLHAMRAALHARAESGLEVGVTN